MKGSEDIYKQVTDHHIFQLYLIKHNPTEQMLVPRSIISRNLKRR